MIRNDRLEELQLKKVQCVGLILIMLSYEDCKQKVNHFIESLKSKEIITVLGVSTFMAASYFLFRFLRNQRSPVIRYIHAINENVLKSLQDSQKSREPLIIQQQHSFEHKGIQMVYTLVSKLKQKQRNNQAQIRNPFLPPFQEGLFIQQLGTSHRLLFNKYNFYQQHLLVVTKEFQPQSNPLTSRDFRQTIYTMKALRGLYFFNSGPNAGASQIHKHLQIFPNQGKNLPVFRSILQFVKQIKYRQKQSNNMNPEQLEIIEYPYFNFKHGLIILSSNEGQSQSENGNFKEENNNNDLKITTFIDNTFRAYEKLRRHLVNSPQGQDGCDYNMFGCEHFIMMIPRKKEKAFNEISVNAVGFMGSILFKDKNLLQKYVKEDRRAHQILDDITFQKHKNT